jgi:hypothetical protein
MRLESALQQSEEFAKPDRSLQVAHHARVVVFGVPAEQDDGFNQVAAQPSQATSSHDPNVGRPLAPGHRNEFVAQPLERRLHSGRKIARRYAHLDSAQVAAGCHASDIGDMRHRIERRRR